MKVTTSDMRRNPKKILDAVARHESVTLLYRGKPVAQIVVIDDKPVCSASDHEAFGMWADRSDMDDVSGYVRGIRTKPMRRSADCRE
jgi:prevent-host-death family protein